VVRESLAAWKVSIFADSLHLNLENPDQELPEILQNLESNGVHVTSHRAIPFSLEDAFIGIVQRASGKADAEPVKAGAGKVDK
jgi:ABC-2 type transport system ATP-binding protein